MAKGDHIRVKRLGYWHHGIDIGDGTVVHYSGEPGNKRDAQVRRTSIRAFLKGGRREVVRYKQSFTPDKVVRRALSRLGEAQYNLIFNNCEHFARWCKCGQTDSDQVRRAAGTAAGTGTIAIAARGSLVVTSAAGSVAGLSGSGIMAGLAATGPGGVIGGLGTLAAAPAIAANVTVSKMLRDDEHLDDEERAARRAGRTAAKASTAGAAAGTVVAVSQMGTVAGLSGPGIASGLAAIGSTVGGGMAAGAAITVAAPAAAAVGAALAAYKLYRWFSE